MLINENVELNRSEVSALLKGLLYLKFECEETSSLLYSSSPIINTVINKLTKMYRAQRTWDEICRTIPEIYKDHAIDKITRFYEKSGKAFDSKDIHEGLEDYLFTYKLPEENQG